MPENTSLVSVIIPCFNYGRFLNDAVNSILNQTYKNFEIIIINDGSTDKKTLEILQNFNNKPKTRVIHIPNQGVCVARNTGIKQAKGKYILPLDADDRVGETYLEKAVKILDINENIGIVSCKARFFGAKFWMDPLINKFNFPKILLQNTLGNSSVFRKSDWDKVNGYNENMKSGWEDYNFWLSIISLNKDVYFLPETLYFYRQHFKLKSRNNSFDINTQKNIYMQIINNNKKLYLDNIDFVFKNIIDLNEEMRCKNRYIKVLIISFGLFILIDIFIFMLIRN